MRSDTAFTEYLRALGYTRAQIRTILHRPKQYADTFGHDAADQLHVDLTVWIDELDREATR